MASPGHRNNDQLDDEPYNVEPGVRRNLFGSQGDNINTQRQYRQSLHASMMAAMRNNQQVSVDVHHEEDDVLPGDLPGAIIANSTQREQNANEQVGNANPTPGIQRPIERGNQNGGLDNIEEFPYPEGEGVEGTEFSTPSNVFIGRGIRDSFILRPKPAEAQNAEEITTENEIRKRPDLWEKKITDLYEQVFNLQQKNRKVSAEKEKAVKERQEYQDLLEDALLEEKTVPRRFETVSKYLDLKGALQIVRNFSGDGSDKLDCFLKSVTSAKKLVHPELQDLLLEAIMGSKLDGNAMKQLKHRMITSYEQ